MQDRTFDNPENIFSLLPRKPEISRTGVGQCFRRNFAACHKTGILFYI
jgi:hypothetical protein